jgi:DNA-binding response OmpR family regulator
VRPKLNLLLSYAGCLESPWVERLPKLLEPLGIRSHQAKTVTEATDTIRTYPIHIALVDLGMPMDCLEARNTPSGPQILELLRRVDAPPPIVAVKPDQSHRDSTRQLAAALKAGVFAVVDRPHGPGDLELILSVLQRCLRRHYQDRWPQQT